MAQPLAGRLESLVNARSDPAERLARLVEVREWLDEAELATVDACRDAGASWSAIGRILGIPRTSAHARYGERGGWRNPVTPRKGRSPRASDLPFEPW
jgi:hypothetical protein